MLYFNTLEDTNIETIHETFVKAFSDYQVEINLSLGEFNKMLQRRGYSAEFSIGAFKDGELRGFILNGIRNWRGMTTVYDCGTGVIPEERKQGITSEMFSQVLSFFRNNNIKRYLLEVIQSNEPAVNLYLKQGFSVTRSFSCFRKEKALLNELPTSSIEYEAFDVERINWKLFRSFWDCQPSWQNSTNSIKAVANSFKVIIARFAQATVGYGIIDKSTGDIPQLAVHKAYRRQGIGGQLLKKLVQHTAAQTVNLNNIDRRGHSLSEFLQSLGFEKYAEQYEMTLNI